MWNVFKPVVFRQSPHHVPRARHGRDGQARVHDGRTPCSLKDKNLWSFAYQLAVDADDLRKLEECWQECWGKLGEALNAEFRSVDTLKRLSVIASKAGSVANGTNIAWSDMDQVVVLNVGSVVQERMQNNERIVFWKESGVPVSIAMDDLRRCIQAAVTGIAQLAESRQWPFRLTRSRFEGKLSCGFEWGPYEWDVLFALRNNFGENLMLEALQPSDNRAASSRIDRAAVTFVGLREVIRCLKILVFDWNERHQSTEGLKGSLCETIVLEVADERCVKWWNMGPNLNVGEKGTSFGEIIVACFFHLRECLVEKKKVSPQNDPTVDLLGKRHDLALVTELLQWIDRNVELCKNEDELLKQLIVSSGIKE